MLAELDVVEREGLVEHRRVRCKRNSALEHLNGLGKLFGASQQVGELL